MKTCRKIWIMTRSNDMLACVIGVCGHSFEFLLFIFQIIPNDRFFQEKNHSHFDNNTVNIPTTFL